MKPQKNDFKLGMQYREFNIHERKIDVEARTIEVTFSSETPIQKWYGREILDHSPSSANFERLNTKSAPFLVNHNRNEQVGVVESARIGADRRGHALLRFGRSQKAEEIFLDVQDEIRNTISFGYRIHKLELEESNEDENTYRATDWEVFEISLESIPADISVGVDRSEGSKNDVTVITQNRSSEEMKKPNEQENVETRDNNNPPAQPPQVDTRQAEATAVENERIRQKEIRSIAETFNLESKLVEEHIDQGTEIDAFRQVALKALETQRSIDTKAANLDLSETEKRKYSLANLLAAMVKGDYRGVGFEMEISDELSKRLNKDPDGVFVPHEVLVGRIYTEIAKRDLLASGGAAPLVADDHLAGSFIELLRNRAVVQQLGVLTLTGLMGNVEIPRQDGAATGEWIDPEGSAVTASDQTFGTLTLGPKSVGADTVIGRQAILQANPSIEALVMNDLIRVLALLIDLGAIAGTGANGQPTGILNTAGIGSVSMVGGLSWAGVVELETDVAAANGDLASMAYLTNATIRGGLKTTKKDDGSGIFLYERGEVNGYPCPVSNQVAAGNMLFGAWSQLIMAFWGVLDLMVNPYLLADNRKVKIHATQSVDIGVRHAASFSASTDIP
jgi:HK97 family phage major capsid protein